METVLNHQASTPLYRQLADELCEAIQAGVFAVGGRIPSEPALAVTYGIGRPTVRQATDCLVRRGLLERRRGAGTFVIAAREPVDLFTLGGTAAAFEGAGLNLQTTVVAPVVLTTSLPETAGPLVGRAGFMFARVGCVDGEPVLLEQMALEQATFPGFAALPLGAMPLSTLVERYYQRRPTSGRQTLRAHATGAPEAELLAVAVGHNVLLVERTLDFGVATNVFFARMLVVTDRVALTQTLVATMGLGATTFTREKPLDEKSS
jgi:GntR family transcriptional regulator